MKKCGTHPKVFQLKGDNPPGISSLYLASCMDVVLSELNIDENKKSLDIAEFLILTDFLVWDTKELDIGIFSLLPSFNNGLLLKRNMFFQILLLSV